MELRWYQTYDKQGRESEWTLQFRNDSEDLWEDVRFVRTPEPHAEEVDDD